MTEKRKAAALVRGDRIVDERASVKGVLAENAIAWTSCDGLQLVDLRVGPYVQQWAADAEVEVEPTP